MFSQRKSVGIVARQWAMACVLFVGVGGGSLPVIAGSARIAQIRGELKSGKSVVAEQVLRSLGATAPLWPLLQEFSTIRETLGLEQNHYGNMILGDPVVRDFTGTAYFSVVKDGQIHSTGQAIVSLNPLSTSIPISVTFDRETEAGATEWVLNQTVSLKEEMISSAGSVVAFDVNDPDWPKVRAVGVGEWLYDISPQNELVAVNMSMGNTAAMSDPDLLADEATDGIGDCAAAAVAASCTSVIVGITIVVVIVVLIFCYVFGWYFCHSGSAIIGDPFDLKSRLEQALKVGDERCIANV